MRRCAEPDRHLLGETAIERGIIGRPHLRRVLLAAQRGQELRGVVARLVLEERRALRARLGLAQSFDGRDVSRNQPLQAHFGGGYEEFLQRRESLAEEAHQVARGLPVLGAQAADAAMAAFAGAQIGLRLLQRRADALQPLAEVGRAKGRQLERAPASAQLARGHAEPAERMLQERHQRHRLETRRRGLDDEIEERADGGLAQRLPGRVLHAQVPGGETGGHAARQHAIGRNQRRRSARRLHHLAQDERDRLGLVLGAGRLQDGDTGKRLRHLLAPDAGHEPVPALRRARRPHRLAHQRGARIERRTGRRTRQRQHVLAPHAQGIQQLLETELGVLGVLRYDRVPALLVERLVEPRQHQGAVRQTGNDAEQLRHRGHAAHDAGDDHGRVGRLLPQPLRLRQHQLLVVLHLRDQAMLLQVRRPGLGHDPQERERPLPVLRERVGHERLHARGIDILDLHRVHQPGELARQLGRLRRRAGAALRLGPGDDELGERELSSHVADRRPQLAGGVGGEVLRARQRTQVLFRRADDGPDPGQQQRRAARRLEERLLQGTRRPPCRQQQGRVGEEQRAGPRPAWDGQVARQQRLGQRRQEWPARRNRVDAAGLRQGLAPLDFRLAGSD